MQREGSQGNVREVLWSPVSHSGLRGLKVSHCSLSKEECKASQTRYHATLKSEKAADCVNHLLLPLFFSYCTKPRSRLQEACHAWTIQEIPSSNTQNFCIFPLWQREKMSLWNRTILPAAMTSLPPQRKSLEHYAVYRTSNKLCLHVFIPRV